MIDAGTVGDAWGSLRATVGFALVLLLPGYALGGWLKIAGWKRLSTGERLQWSCALSVAVVPVLSVLLLKYAGWRALLCAGVVCWFLAGWQAFSAWKDVGRAVSNVAWYTGGLAVGAWTAFVVGELLDIGTRGGGHGHLYLSVTVYDHALRTLFVDAVMRTGAPPTNPLFWPGHPAAMRYYYFWYVVTAAIAKLTGTTARQALIASVVWAGVALAAAIGLYGRWFLPERTVPGRRSRLVIGAALLGVAGLDILPAIAKAVARLPMDPDVDWWAPDQVTTWLGSLLWVPHHVAALVCCVTSFLLVWISRGETRVRLCYAALAGVGIASAFGLSIWVALAFGISVGGWAVWAWWLARSLRPRVKTLLAAAAFAAVVVSPYVRELAGEPSGVVTISGGGADAQASAGRLVRLGVRRTIDTDDFVTLPGFSRVAKMDPLLEEILARLSVLVPGYFAELGFWSVVLVLLLRASGLSEAERTARVLVIAGLLVTTFVRSTVIANNDFGLRSALVMQFFLLLMGVRWAEKRTGQAGTRMRRFAWVLLWIGVAGSVYEAVLLRVYLPVQELSGNPAVVGLSERAAALRTALTDMNERVDQDAVVQFDSNHPGEYFRYAQIQFANRQITSALPACTVAFGGDARDCVSVEARTAALFAVARGGEEGVMSAAEATVLCAGLGTTELVATRWDGVWQDRAGWVWNLPKVVDTGDVRVVSCGR